MARPLKMPQDPIVYAQLIEDLAYGLPQVVIARALEVDESQITRWKQRKDFARDLAAKKLEVLRGPIQSIAETAKLTFIERHPDTRDQWRPPTQHTETKNEHTVNQIEITMVKPAQQIEGAGDD